MSGWDGGQAGISSDWGGVTDYVQLEAVNQFGFVKRINMSAVYHTNIYVTYLIEEGEVGGRWRPYYEVYEFDPNQTPMLVLVKGPERLDDNIDEAIDCYSPRVDVASSGEVPQNGNRSEATSPVVFAWTEDDGTGFYNYVIRASEATGAITHDPNLDASRMIVNPSTFLLFSPEIDVAINLDYADLTAPFIDEAIIHLTGIYEDGGNETWYHDQLSLDDYLNNFVPTALDNLLTNSNFTWGKPRISSHHSLSSGTTVLHANDYSALMVTHDLSTGAFTAHHKAKFLNVDYALTNPLASVQGQCSITQILDYDLTYALDVVNDVFIVAGDLENGSNQVLWTYVQFQGIPNNVYHYVSLDKQNPLYVGIGGKSMIYSTSPTQYETNITWYNGWTSEVAYKNADYAAPVFLRTPPRNGLEIWPQPSAQGQEVHWRLANTNVTSSVKEEDQPYEIFSLTGQRVADGKGSKWAGRRADGRMISPGIYVLSTMGVKTKIMVR